MAEILEQGDTGSAGGMIGGIISAAGGILNGLFSTIGRIKATRDVSFAEIPALESALTQIGDMIKNNEASEEEALGLIETSINATSGKLKTVAQGQLKAGLQSIAENAQRSLDEIRFNVQEAQKEADEQEKQALENLDEQLQEVSDSYDEANKELTRSFGQRRLGGSGAFLAAVNKGKEQFGKIQSDFAKQKGDIVQGIARQMGALRRQANFQSGQVLGQAGTASRDLTSSVQAQLGRELAGLDTQKLGMSLQTTQRAEDISRQLAGEQMALETKLAQTQAAMGPARNRGWKNAEAMGIDPRTISSRDLRRLGSKSGHIRRSAVEDIGAGIGPV